MLVAARKSALPGVAVLTTVAMFGCGSGGKTSGDRTATAGRGTSAATGGAEHPIDMFPALETQSATDRSTIVRVGSTPITRATFVHWDEVLTPKLASYEPKSRADCSEVRAPIEVKLPNQGATKLSAAQVKALCVRQHQSLVRESVIQQLISYQWVLGEAAELGLSPDEAEVRQSLAKSVSEQFKSKAEFLRYIGESGRTIADALLEVRREVVTQRIQELIKRKPPAALDRAALARYYRTHVKKISPEGVKPLRDVEGVVREKLSEELFNREKASFVRAFRKKWLARTSCSADYVVSRCREWRGPSVLVSEDPYGVG
jgi:hypothetical protein